MSGGTVWVGGLVGRRLLFGSVGSGSDEGGGESQCTDENSESAIAGDGSTTRAADAAEGGRCGGLGVVRAMPINDSVGRLCDRLAVRQSGRRPCSGLQSQSKYPFKF